MVTNSGEMPPPGGSRTSFPDCLVVLTLLDKPIDKYKCKSLTPAILVMINKPQSHPRSSCLRQGLESCNQDRTLTSNAEFNCNGINWKNKTNTGPLQPLLPDFGLHVYRRRGSHAGGWWWREGGGKRSAPHFSCRFRDEGTPSKWSRRCGGNIYASSAVSGKRAHVYLVFPHLRRAGWNAKKRKGKER